MTSESKVRALPHRPGVRLDRRRVRRLAAVLAISAVALLVVTAGDFAGKLFSGNLVWQIVPLLDRVLLILLVVEMLYTVQVSFREHALTPEPFLLIGIISAIRRVLVVTAEFGQTGQAGSQADRARARRHRRPDRRDHPVPLRSPKEGHGIAGPKS